MGATKFWLHPLIPQQIFMKTKNICLLGGTVASLFVIAPRLTAQTPAPAVNADGSAKATAPTDPNDIPCCGPKIAVQGGIEYFKPEGPDVQGTTHPEWFKEQLFGRTFTVLVPELPAGRYTIKIDVAEQYHQQAGQRVMDIAVEDQKLAQNLDVFTAAGGYKKAYVVEGTVNHRGVGLPLVITFSSTKDNATFDAIRIFNEKGVAVAGTLASSLHTAEDLAASVIPVVKGPAIYQDPRQSNARRVHDMVRRMSLAEKVAQIQNGTPAIERLNLPSYGYPNEALHGIGFAGRATVFPQAIGMAASWNDSLLKEVADTIATEGRAKYVVAQARGDHNGYRGLTFWSPNINIFRDPRWGRGQETYGEDPELTSRMAVAFITGMQGNDPKYLKVMACAKHFAVHSGPEPLRHDMDVTPPERDMYETYLPAFETSVREAKVRSVMSAYNSVNGQPASANPFLLDTMLRKNWGFKGHVVSDCGAIHDIWNGHKYLPDAAQATARAIKSGTDLECGNDYHALVSAVNQKLLKESEIDRAVERVLTV
ncbi:hypothetical protein EON80_20955, partial [bacterium]